MYKKSRKRFYDLGPLYMERVVPVSQDVSAIRDHNKLAFICKNVIPSGRDKFKLTSRVTTTHYLILPNLVPPGRDISATSLYLQKAVPSY